MASAANLSTSNGKEGGSRANSITSPAAPALAYSLNVGTGTTNLRPIPAIILMSSAAPLPTTIRSGGWAIRSPTRSASSFNLADGIEMPTGRGAVAPALVLASHVIKSQGQDDGDGGPRSAQRLADQRWCRSRTSVWYQREPEGTRDGPL